MKNTMLHMKLNSAVSVFAVAAAFSVLLPPSNAFGGVCFLPDCAESGVLDGNHNMDINSDSKFCEDNGYVSSCPENTSKIPDSECYRDASYFKCSEAQWCKDNGYSTTSCSVPQYPSEQCPNGEPLYKSCKTDNAKACKELGYTNTCPSGQKLKKDSRRCSYDSSYGTCCTPSGCPNYTSLTPSSYGTNGTDGCEYTCYYTCNPNCPSGTSTSNPEGCGGSTKNGCGNVTCYYPYQSCCTPTCNNAGHCSRGSYLIDNGCGEQTCSRCYGEIGDIYYSDGSISNEKISNKTPIGIIFQKGENYGYIISLDETRTTWGPYSDTPLTNISDDNCTNGEKAKKDFDGQQNTNKILKSVSSPAAKFCNNYSTAGTSAGEWFLPALGQLYQVYANQGKINSSLNKINKPLLSNGSYWSSTEARYDDAWGIYIYTGKMCGNGDSSAWKSSNNYVRAIKKIELK